jgi:hypothetical protein
MNLNPLLLLAQVRPEATDPEAIRRTFKTNAGSNTEVIIILGCALALSVVLFVWAFFIRKRPKSARGSLVVERRRVNAVKEEDTKRRRRRRRPDHPDNWGRNPTLGETGGLPPARENEENPQTDPEVNPHLNGNQDVSSGNPQPRSIRPR